MRLNWMGDRYYLWMTGILLLLSFTMFRPWVHGMDGAGYYSWLRSCVIQGNLDTTDELLHFGSIQRADLQINAWSAVRINHYPVGSAVLWAPFFLTAHILVYAAHMAGIDIPADGYSWPYILLTTLGSVVWGFAGLTIIYRIAAAWFGHFAAGLGTIAVWLATPLVFYMYAHPAMSHANDMFVNALFILVWLSTRKDRKWWGWLTLGLVAGICTMVRTQNGLLIIFPCIELLIVLIVSLRRQGSQALNCVGYGALFAAGSIIGFIPQMQVWQRVYDEVLVANAQQASMGLGFHLFHPHIGHLLFSSDRGLFVWSPIAVLGISGIFLLFRSDRRLAAFLLCNVLLQLYLVSSWAGWSGGVSFGPRLLINLVPAFAIGCAAWIHTIEQRVNRNILVFIGALFVIWNFGLIAQYTLQLIPRIGKVSIWLMITNQFTAVPQKIIGLIMNSVLRA